MTVSSRWPGYALALVVLVTVWRLALLALAPPNLSFDEAQYWAWAQTIQLGYYSKPPMVAWAIAATTALFGEGEGAIKLSSTLAHTATALLLFALGREMFDRRVGAWAAVGWIVLPAVSLSSMVITTDPFLLTCWAAALLFLVKAERQGAAVNVWWGALGLAFGLGLLSKYAMAFFLLGLALWMVLEPSARRLLKGGGLWLALALAVLVYAPNGLWNAANGFVSYAHTRDNANLGGTLFNFPKLAEFVGGQFGVAGPILMAAILFSLVVAFRRNADPRLKLLAAFTVPVLLVMTVESFLSRANANWTAPAYVAGVVLASAVLASRAPRLLLASLLLHLLATGVLYNIDAVRHGLGLAENTRLDPMKRIRGWDKVGDRVSALLAEHPGARLLADERKVLATLTYYVHPHPFDAIKWNPGGQIHDHFDQTTRLEPGGGSYVYVTENPGVPESVIARFGEARGLGTIDDHLSGDHGRVLSVWWLRDFKGYGK
ncbi:ArnT family glycosyltransferase [Magnetospirillum sulfuroxidans]|uniref:Glycosyltransferase family 39 protein n=1 Tax=Magnetospirillum sulfuroxidans TaxID=611300 RepID=A0ABS5IDM5_9PROT|nr:glycosyltransferase family 39 protein [Magnetospirillum sulfuroxidans]MBR9971828.1 glycosyltransferase family 39 protein [Magnetospirillum sulfuroxidans]